MALAAPGGSLENFPNNLLYATSDSGFTYPGVETYGYKQGTSFSAPLAAGVASLMLARNATLTPRALIERMQAGARPHLQPLGPGGPVCSAANTQVCHCTADTCGAGLLDAHTALQLSIGPAAVIQPVGTVVPGAVITLDGRSSVALGAATIASYQWSLDSGPAVMIPNGTQALTSLQLPSVEGRWVLRLTVTDSNGDDGSDAIVVRAVAPPPPASASASGGGGSFAGWWGLGLALWSAGLMWANRRR